VLESGDGKYVKRVGLPDTYCDEDDQGDSLCDLMPGRKKERPVARACRSTSA
jgi:hypothetical protein